METEKEEAEHFKKNEIGIGDLQMSSTELSLEQLINLTIACLQNKTIKEYLSLIKKRKMLTGTAYAG